MTYSVRFYVKDSDTPARNVTVAAGTPLSVAAADAGLPLRNDCGGQGICGKCKVLIENAEQLACRTFADADLDVTLPESSLRNDVTVVRHFSGIEGRLENRREEKYRYGAALDIGTTTLAAELFELSHPEARFLGGVGRTNPQRNFGDDVITRIQKIIEEPDFLALFQSLILGAVDEMLDELAAQAGIDRDAVSLLTVSGNTVMEHIFLGIDPSPLGVVPFAAPVTDFPCCRGEDIGLRLGPGGAAEGRIETMPAVGKHGGGFVGGDIVSGVLATGLYRTEETAFLIDIGTNGELVLSHRGELYTTATAAGPAFEGARIEYGMTAAPGAVDRVELHSNGTVTLSTIGGQKAVGICGSGLIDLASEMLRHGLIAPNGRFDLRPDSPFLPRWKIVDNTPAFELVPADESGRNEAILLTQRDVRQLQLATGAIRAGIVLLLRQLGLTAGDISTFYVAGGFGSYITPESARRIGLLPKEIPPERIRFCGNTSLAGARMALLDPERLEEARRLAQACHPVELAALPDFATVFAESMIF